MSETPVMPGQQPEVTSDDKLMALLAYIFAPISGLILLMMEDKAARPFIKFHVIQSIAASIALIVIVSITAPFTLGCTGVLFLIQIWWAIKAYQGEMFEIPVITSFIKNQGWV